jgi:hypothetical protein
VEFASPGGGAPELSWHLCDYLAAIPIAGRRKRIVIVGNETFFAKFESK